MAKRSCSLDERRDGKDAALRWSGQSSTVVPPGLEGGWYKPLRDDDVKRIHGASLEVLQRTGIEIPPSECREVFRRAGARIDHDANRVHIPPSMVEDALASAPHDVLLCGRDSRHDLRLSGWRVHMGTGGAATKVLDLNSGRVRKSTLADIAKTARLVDALDNIHFYLRTCVARDIPVKVLDVNTYYAAIANTTKHVTGSCLMPESARDVIEMASMIAGSRETLRKRPIVSFVTSWMVSPLRYAPDVMEVVTALVREGMPVFLSSAPQSGATSPAALAGTLVQINAEELSGVVYTQLLNPCAPIILGNVPSVSDLRTAIYAAGAPEFALMQAAVVQLGRFYNLPVCNSGGLTDSKVSDIQAGYEKAISSMAAALAGANYIHHSAGFLESMLTVAYEQYVIDDDINGSVMRAVRGIDVNDDTLSVDVIDRVCRRGENHFLSEQQTLAMMNTEYFYPHIADRQTRQQWRAGGRLDARARARQLARHLVETHVPEPISARIDDAIRQRFDIRLPPELSNLRPIGHKRPQRGAR